jgi:hypothetical protein
MTRQKSNQTGAAQCALWTIPPKYGERASFSIRETAEILGISVWGARAAAKRGELPVISIGRRKIVPRVRLERLMNGE